VKLCFKKTHKTKEEGGGRGEEEKERKKALTLELTGFCFPSLSLIICTILIN
jgi:hypothetical protein